jgi:hypothetical protein
VGPRAGLDAGARRKILCLFRGSNPDRPARSQTPYYLSYRGSYQDGKIKQNVMVGTCSTHRIAIYLYEQYKTLVEKSEGKRQLERPLDRWEEKIRIYLKK